MSRFSLSHGIGVVCSLLLWGFLVVGGCGPSSDTQEGNASQDGGVSDGVTPEGASSTSCVPSKSVWDKTVKELVASRCNQCHGENVNYGAPYSLIDYDTLVKGEIGKRQVDRIAARMLKKTMPPQGTPQLPHAELDTLVEWATCGEKHADHSIGFTSTANVFRAPPEPPKTGDIEKVDMLANKFEVGEHVLDLYQCFTFEAPNQVDRFIKRIETVVDESRVLHHTVLLRVTNPNTKLEKVFKCRGTPGDTQYMYAWAPGGGAVEFPDGGVRMKPGDRFIVQIHYNNGAGVKNAVDSSGIRIYHGPAKGTEYGMLVPGPHTFSVPPKSDLTVSSSCTMGTKTRILANMPHMHEIGSEFVQKIKRKDGAEEMLILLTGWSFEFQNFYETPMTLEEGDKIITTCTFKNNLDVTVKQGGGTKDEMCFGFMYVTPPPKGTGYCNELGEQLEYKPGKCGVDASSIFVPVGSGKFVQEKAPAFKGGEIPQSKWVVKEATLYMNSDTYGTIQLDFKKSHILSKGILSTEGGKLHLDVLSRLALRGPDTLSFDTDSQSSFAGDLKADTQAGTFVLENGCGDFDKSTYQYEVNGNTLTVAITPKGKGGLLDIIDTIVMSFEKIDS